MQRPALHESSHVYRTRVFITQITACVGGISAALGPNIFTDIAFECTSGQFLPETQRRLYAASAAGAVFEIDYNTCVSVWNAGLACLGVLCILFCVVCTLPLLQAPCLRLTTTRAYAFSMLVWLVWRAVHPFLCGLYAASTAGIAYRIDHNTCICNQTADLACFSVLCILFCLPFFGALSLVSS